MHDRAWRTTAISLGQTHWHNRPEGIYNPLSLKEFCIRCICIRLLSEPASVFRILAYQIRQHEKLRKQQNLLRDCESEKAPESASLSADLATAILAWFRDRQVICKHHFQLLAYYQMLDWNLRFCSDVDDAWLEDVPTHVIELLQSLNVSYCHRLQFCGLNSQSRLPNLRTANFDGCLYLKPETIQRLQFSSRLISLNLTGCRLITDKTLYSLRHLFRLQVLHLSGCKWITEKGLQHLNGLFGLKRLYLARCVNVSNQAFRFFPTSFPNLIELDVSHCSISDIAMHFIGRLKEMSSLALKGCSRVTTKGLSHLGSLLKLRRLDFRYCKHISGLCKEWTQLNALWLSCTNFKESDAFILATMKYLQELDLRCCVVTKCSFTFVSQLQNLVRLCVAETALTDESLIVLCKRLKKLQLLDISCTEVTDSGTILIDKLEELRELHMDTPGITNRSLGRIGKLKKLARLNLFAANVTDEGVESLAQLEALHDLAICSGGIGPHGVKVLSQLKKLGALNLSQNKWCVVHLGALTELRYLNLSNTSISSSCLHNLYALKHLESLSVYGVILDASQIDELQVNLPQLKVLRCS
ncbi:unnamed protein product [Albugo candida]|nr:unnamed protein product [Albugo candida]|eukprot:CCI39442.1 unnamed protein product [Albugo candida]